MRKSARKFAAALLSTALVVTSVNLPSVTSEAASKKPKLNKKKATLYINGTKKQKTVTLKLKKGSKKLKAKFTSNKKKVATVNKSTGKVTAKKVGKAVITAKYQGKKYKCTITVKKKSTPKKTTAPSKAPAVSASAVPSGAPSESSKPSDNPSVSSNPSESADPSATPAAKLTEISELKATTAATLVATFTEATPDDTTIEVTKGSAAVDGKVSWNEARTEATFAATANMTAGTYKLTAKSGETSVSKEVEVKDEYAAEIKITSKDALTNKDKTEAYIYYDVLNQYGESIRTSTTINWTVSSCDSFTVNKTTGKITAKKKAGEVFNYGTEIYLTGVHVKSGLSVTTSIKVGMEQAINSIKFVGFLSKDDKTKILTNLPTDFAANKYVLLYQTLDQDGNLLDAADDNIAQSRLTFITDNIMLIKSEFSDDVVYTIDAVEYSSVTLQPGMYVDKGGEVNITAISNTTGQKTPINIVIGATPLLKSLVLDTPADAIADGDTVELPYTAKDVDGNVVTNYETIVRSTNKLNITASEGTLTVSQKDDGTAKITWADDVKYDAANVSIWGESSSRDEVDRNISLVTTVIGGESNSLLLPVSDARRPVAIKDVKIASATGDNTGIIAKRRVEDLSITPGSTDSWADGITYLDQYGKELAAAKATAFFQATQTNSNDKSGGYKYDGYQYGIRVDVKANQLGLTNGGKVYMYGANIDMTAEVPVNSQGAPEVASNTVKYSIVKAASSGAIVGTTNTDMDSWDDVSKVKSVSYTIVPTEKASGFALEDWNRLGQITTDNSDKENGMAKETEIKDGDVVPGEPATGNWFDVMATYKGMNLKVPDASFEVASGSAININSWGGMASIKAGELKWSDLYDENSARLTRKNAVLPLAVQILNSGDDTANTEVKKSVNISDAAPKATSVEIKTGGTVYPTNTQVGSAAFVAEVKDQYGNVMAEPVEFNISGITENTAEFSHLPSSFAVSGNGTGTITINGAEIMDKFSLTVTVTGTTVTASKDITVGADTNAKITNGSSDPDETFRKTYLGYDR